MKDLLVFLKRFALPYKWNIVASVLLNTLTSLLTLFSFAFIIPILKMLFGLDSTHYEYMAIGQGSLKDVVINDFYYLTSRLIVDCGPSTALGILAVALVLMTLLKVLTSYFSELCTFPLRNGVVRDIRNEMYGKILSLPIGFFSEERKGDIMARMSGDVTEIEISVMSSLFSLVKYPVMILACLVMMIAISWQLTAFVFVLLPVVGYVMGLVGKKLKATSLRLQEIWGTILSNTEESIGGLRVIKAFNAANHMNVKFRGQTQEYYKVNNQLVRRTALAHPMSEFLGTSAVAAVLWFGGTLILGGGSQIDAATFIYYMVLFYSIINPAKDLSKTLFTVQKGMASLKRIDKILGADNPIKDPEHTEKTAESGVRRGEIVFDHVDFSYIPGRPVLRDICLEIKPGQTVAIVGQSGSGKSTLVDLVPRFYDVCGGAVRVDGVDVRDYKVDDLRSMMGIVSQDAILFNDSFYNNIVFGMKGVGPEDVRKAACIANAAGFIEETSDGYDSNVGDRGCRLSGGQRQRISIARAILKNPPVLILDEATSALDTESETLVQEALDRLMADRTTIVVAHRLSTIRNADMICVVSDGRIVERGSHEELMAADGHYRRLVEMQGERQTTDNG